MESYKFDAFIMKKLLLLSVSIILLNLSAFAQKKVTDKAPIPFVKGIGIDGKLIVGNQKIDYTNLENSQWQRNLTTYGVGFFLELFGNRFFNFKPNIGFLQKGFKDVNPTFNGLTAEGVTFEPKFSYVNTDLMFKVTLGTKKIKPYVEFGARGDMLVGRDKITFEAINEYGQEVQQKDMYKELYDDMKKLNWGALVVTGVELFDRFDLEIEYNPAFNEVVSAANNDLDIESVYTRIWSINLGIKLK